MKIKSLLKSTILCMVIVICLSLCVSAAGDLSISSTHFGNIFYEGETPEFEVVTSGLAATIKYVVKDGNEVISSLKGSVAAVDTTTIVTLDKTKMPFGCFTFEAQAYDGSGRFIGSNNAKFSYIRIPASANYKTGIYGVMLSDPNDFADIDSLYTVFKKIGMSTVRQEFKWEQVEKSKGVYALTDTMKMQKTATNVFTDRLYVLCNGNANVYGSGYAVPTTDDERAKFGNYAAQLDSLLEDSNVAYEVWNEYNGKNFNPEMGSKTTAELAAEYAALLTTTADSVKTQNPEAKIVAMGVEGISYPFVSGVINNLDQATAERIDAIGIHPYAWAEPMSEEWFQQRGSWTIGDLRNMMNQKSYGSAYPLRDTEIWATEVGWQNKIGADRQANYTIQYLIMNDAYGLIDKTLFYRYARTYTRYPSNEEFGFIDNAYAETPYSALPVTPAVSFYNKLMNGATYQKTLAYDSDTKVYQFRLADGRYATATYTNKGEKTLNLNLGASSVVVYDIYGNETNLSSSDNNYLLTIGEGMTYIVSNSSSLSKGGAVGVVSISKTTLDPKETATLTVLADDYSIEKSSNVSIKGNTVSVVDFDSETPWIKVTAKEDGQAKEVKKIVFTKGYDAQQIYALNSTNWSGAEEWDLYQQSFSSERPYSFRMRGSSGSAGTVYVTTDSFANKVASDAYVVVGLDLMFESNSDVIVYLVDSSGTERGFFKATSDGYFTYYSYSSVVSSPDVKINYEKNRWYRINAFINVGSNEARYYVDGEMIGWGVVGASGLAQIKAENISTASTGGVVWLDNITVRKDEPGALSAKVIANSKLSDGAVCIEFSEPVSKLLASNVTLMEGENEIKIHRVVKVSPYQYKVYPAVKFEDGTEYAIYLANITDSVSYRNYNGKVLYFIADDPDKNHTVLYDLIKDGYEASHTGYVSDDGNVLTEGIDKSGNWDWGSNAVVQSHEFEKSVTADTAEVVTMHYEYMHQYTGGPPCNTLAISDTGASFRDEGHRHYSLRIFFSEQDKPYIQYGAATEGLASEKIYRTLEKGRWYSFDTVYNLRTREAEYYIDGELIGVSKNGPQIIRRIGWMPAHAGLSSGPSYWKNVKLMKGDTVNKKYLNIDLFQFQKGGSELVNLDGVNAGDEIVLKFNANSDTSERLQVIYALYNNDVLSQVDYRTVDTQYGTVTLTVPQTVESDADLSIKAFVFDENLTPVVDNLNK